MPTDTLPRAADPVEALAAHPAAGRPRSLAAALEPLLLGRRDAARLCGVSPATWSRWDASGRCPRPLRFSRGCVRWISRELLDWCAAGCPDRRTWEALRDAARRNGRG
jgi:predicted DNA-binding transcriptional regulator AlpA